MSLRSVLLPVLLATLGLAAGGRAQEAGAGAPAEEPQASPRATMFTFLGALHAVQAGELEQWTAATDCLDLSGVDPDEHGARGRAKALWQALNHLREVQPADLPDAAQIGGATSYLYFPRPFDAADDAIVAAIDYAGEQIALQLGDDGRWRFSAGTVRDVFALQQALGARERQVDVDVDALDAKPWLRRWMPSVLVGGELLQVEYWQWLGLLVLAFLGVLLDQMLRLLLAPIVRRGLLRWRAPAGEDAQRGILRPLGLLGAGLLWLLLVRALGFDGSALAVLLAAARTFTILAATWFAWTVTDLLGEIFTERAKATASTIDDVLVPLLRKALKVFIITFGLIYAAQSLNINIVPLITGLGIGGLAFAFAAKDTIENFFGSVAVILDRPFEVGDWVVIGDVEGTVEDLGFRSTRIRTFYNSQITMPNASLVRATVDNYGRRRYRRWSTTLGVQYDTRPDQILAFTEGIRELVRAHPFTRKDYYQVRCREFGASSLDILLYVFFEVPEWSTELRERERLLVDIVRLADRLGVQFAFPTQTLHLHQAQRPGEPAPPREPAYVPPREETDRRAGTDGIRAARELVAQQPWRREKPGPVVFATDSPPLDPADPTGTTEDTPSRKPHA